jgi:hypothetical protein
MIMADWLAALRAYTAATATLDLVCETAYGIGWTGTMAEKAFAVVHCTMADVVIARASPC